MACSRMMNGSGERLDGLRNSLSCPICSVAFSAPLLIMTCGHSFCAECIRNAFDYQERSVVKEGGRLNCPSCRKPCEHRDLVPNVVLRDVVDAYGKAEAWLMGCVERERDVDEVSRGRKRSKKVVGRVEAEVVCLDGADHDGADHDGAPFRSSRSMQSSPSGPSSPSTQSSESSGEEYDPLGSKAVKREPGHVRSSTVARKAAKNAGTSGNRATGHTSSSFLPCPVCGKDVHHMYMNSHVDMCLSGGTGGHANDDPKPLRPRALDVPPKIVLLGGLSNVANEKKLKDCLKRYNIPSEGCASARELFDRYMRFRTAVEVSNDKGEVGASYEKIVFRLMKEERSKKMAGMFALGKKTTKVAGEEGDRTKSSVVTVDMTRGEDVVVKMAGRVEGRTWPERFLAARRALSARYPDLRPIRHPREILLSEDATFEEMVEVTRLRDRVRAMLLEEFNRDEP